VKNKKNLPKWGSYFVSFTKLINRNLSGKKVLTLFVLTNIVYAAMLIITIPLDMIYPFLFGISYCLVIGYFLKKLNKLVHQFINMYAYFHLYFFFRQGKYFKHSRSYGSNF